jgi:hypothetical protein
VSWQHSIETAARYKRNYKAAEASGEACLD